MLINLSDKSFQSIQSDLGIIITSKKCLDTLEDKKILSDLNFKASDEEVILLAEKRNVYVGCEDDSYDSIAIAISAAIKEIKKTKFTSIKLELGTSCNDKLKALVEGAIMASYEFNKYKSKKTKKEKLNLTIVCSKITTSLVNTLEDSIIIAKSVNKVRSYVNTTPEDFYPETFEKEAKKIAKDNKISLKVHGEDYLDKNKMHSMLAVGRASRHESKLIHLTYKSKNPKAKIVLVGKGLTYDSGGLSLKPAEFMAGMKSDKGGGCAVLGMINAISKMKLDVEVHAIIGAVENMIGGDAYKPDDVLVAKNGKTIEVKNTDAEGRLVLADCLAYAQDKIEDITYIFDFATLTGAALVGVGQYTTAIMGNNSSLKCKAVSNALKSGEYATSLPFNRFLKKTIKSEIADISNLASSRYGGAITAALFLDEFITDENKNKWLHFDIAGPAFVSHSWGYNPHGASGAGVRMMVEFIKNIDKDSKNK